MTATPDQATRSGGSLYIKELAALREEFGESVPGETIERCLHQEADRFSAARIRDYVPLFVLRGARAQLRDIAGGTHPSTGRGSSAPDLG